MGQTSGGFTVITHFFFSPFYNFGLRGFCCSPNVFVLAFLLDGYDNQEVIDYEYHVINL